MALATAPYRRDVFTDGEMAGEARRHLTADDLCLRTVPAEQHLQASA